MLNCKEDDGNFGTTLTKATKEAKQISKHGFVKNLLNRVADSVTITHHVYFGNVICNATLQYIDQKNPKKYRANVISLDEEQLRSTLCRNRQSSYLYEPYALKHDMFIRLGHGAYLYVDVNKMEKDNSIYDMQLKFFGKNVAKYVKEYTKFVYHDYYNIGNSRSSTTYKMGFTRTSNDRDSDHIILWYKSKKYIDTSMYFIDENTNNKILRYLNNAIKFSKKCKKEFGKIVTPGILLYGEPGTGKSSMIEYITSMLKVHTVHYLDIAHLDNCIDKLRNVFTEDSQNYSIIALEDIDILFTDRTAGDWEYQAQFNILLQLLDGYLSFSNTIIIATTNHIDRLDPALIREGRFDLKIEISGLSRKEAVKMCDKHGVSSSILNDEEFPINPAHLQSKIINAYMDKMN